MPVTLKNDPSLEKNKYISLENGHLIFKSIDGDLNVIGASYHALSYVQIGPFHLAWDGTAHNHSTRSYGRVFVSTDLGAFKEMLLKRYCANKISSIPLDQTDPLDTLAHHPFAMK